MRRSHAELLTPTYYEVIFSQSILVTTIGDNITTTAVLITWVVRVPLVRRILMYNSKQLAQGILPLTHTLSHSYVVAAFQAFRYSTGSLTQESWVSLVILRIGLWSGEFWFFHVQSIPVSLRLLISWAGRVITSDVAISFSLKLRWGLSLCNDSSMPSSKLNRPGFVTSPTMSVTISLGSYWWCIFAFGQREFGAWRWHLAQSAGNPPFLAPVCYSQKHEVTYHIVSYQTYAYLTKTLSQD